MSVSFKVEDVNISAIRDRAMFNTFAGNQDYVIKGIEDELSVSYSSSSFVVSLGKGEAVIRGGSTIVEGTDNTLTLNSFETGYLVLRVDLSQTGSNICRFLNVPVLEQQDINNGVGLVYDFPLYQYSTNGNGVNSMTDLRKISSSMPITINGIGVDDNGNIDISKAINVNNGTLMQAIKDNPQRNYFSIGGSVSDVPSVSSCYVQVIRYGNTGDFGVAILYSTVYQSNIANPIYIRYFELGYWITEWQEAIKRPKQLWSNSSPTSDFQSQTITLSNLSQYNQIMIVYKMGRDLANNTTEVIPTAFNGAYRTLMCNSYNTFMYRIATVNIANNTINFGNAVEVRPNSGSTADNNRFMIPLYIYGL